MEEQAGVKYRDTGCEFASSCLDCPFPQCVYEYPGGKSAWLKEKRDSEIKRLFKEGKALEELATLFKLSERQIQRIVYDRL